MCPEVEKWYSPVPRNPKMVQSNAEKLKILRTIRPEVQKRYSRGQSRFSSEAMLWKCQAGYAGGVGQSKFISEAMLWKCRTGCTGNVGQSRFRRGALATWSVEIQF